MRCSVGQSAADEHIPALSWHPEAFDAAGSGDEDSLMGSGSAGALGRGSSASGVGAALGLAGSSGSSGSALLNPQERRSAALQALRLMCDCRALQPHLHELLGAK